MTRKIIGIAFAAVGLLVANPLFAANGTMVYNDGGHTPDAALDWNDPNNWVEGQIASGSDSKATLPSANYQPYILAPDGLTLKDIGDTAHPNHPSTRARVICDGMMTLAGAWGVTLYGAVTYTGAGSALSGVSFCGPVTAADGVTLGGQESMGFRRDLFADSPSEEIVDPFSQPNLYIYQNQTFTFCAPRGSEAVTGTWTMTEGSKFLTLAGEAHTVAVGTTVSGEGIPEGAYVKRYFTSPSEMIEISGPATASGDKAVTFAAFTPKMRQTIRNLYVGDRSTSYTGTLAVNKFREEDDLRVDILTMENNRQFDVIVSASSGWVPGTLAFHRTVDWKKDRTLTLGNCHVEFDDPGDGSAAGWTTGSTRLSSAAVTARVTVTNGVAARLAKLIGAAGTLVKDGAGTLTAAIPDTAAFAAAGKGTLVVEEGTFALETAEGDSALEFAKVTVAAGATLVVPAGGLRCDVVEAEEGANITGEGRLFISWSHPAIVATLGPAVQVVRIADESMSIASDDYFAEPPAPATMLPGVPALWVDVTVPGMIVATNAKGRASKIIDVRGESYGYTSTYNTDGSRGPQIITNADGSVNHIYMSQGNTTAQKSTDCIKWSRKISGIKAIYKVLYGVNGGGQLVGTATYWRNSKASTLSMPLFCNAPEAYSNAPCFYANGELRDWRDGLPYTGGSSSDKPENLVPTVVEFYPPDNAFSMQGFGWGNAYEYGYSDESHKGVNGHDRFCECIIYTNELTVAEKLAIRGYLMKRWLNAEANHDPTLGRGLSELDLSQVNDIEVPEDKVVNVGTIAGAGTFVKEGAGQLVLANQTNANRAITVAAGQLTIRSWDATTSDGLPGDPALHLDPSDSESIENWGADNMVWHDVRGAGYPSATYLNTTYKPSRVAGACHGLAIMDCGEWNPSRSSRTSNNYAFKFPCMDVRTFFSVVGSAKGGGMLLGHLGDDETLLYRAGGAYNGLYRAGGSAANAMLGSDYTDLGRAPQPGRHRFRLNGADVAPLSTGFSGEFDLVSGASYAPIYASNLAQERTGTSDYHSRGNQNGEFILYTNTLSRTHVEQVEAYLSKKWFGRETAGYRPAQLGALTVADGATVKVEGNAPLTVSALSGAGAVNGALKLAAGAVLTAVADADGVIQPISVTGGADISAGGTVMIDSPVAKLAAGSYNLLPVNSEAGTWQIGNADEFKREMSLAVRDGYLVLTVYPNGLLLLVR